MTPEKENEILEKAIDRANAMYPKVVKILIHEFNLNKQIKNQKVWTGDNLDSQEFIVTITAIEMLTAMIISNAIKNLIIHSKMPVSDIFDQIMHNVRMHAEDYMVSK